MRHARTDNTVLTFTRDTSGLVTMVFALTATLLMGMLALAVDLGNAFKKKSQVMAALDSAALAGARELAINNPPNGKVKQIAKSVFEANAEATGIDDAIIGQPEIDISREEGTVRATATVTSQSYFARFLQNGDVTFTSSAVATLPGNEVEVALALDFTGSMESIPAGDTKTKFEALRASAIAATDALYDTSPSDKGVRVAIVPWTTSVNVGSQIGAKVASDPTFTCVTNRESWSDRTDSLAGAGDFLSWDDAYCPGSAILPLQDKNGRSTVRSYLQTMATTPGATGGHLGAAWAWYLLSPKWSSVLPAASQPSAYGPRKQKIMVFISDGLFNYENVTGSETHSEASTDFSYEVFQDLCANMKAKAVKVFAVAVDITPGTRAETELKTCATSDAYFFNAEDAASLTVAFTKITDEIKHLRLSE